MNLLMMSDMLPGPLGDIARHAREEREKKDKLGCSYPDCSNHKPGVTRYCCAGCRQDHHDWLEAHDPTPEQEVSIDTKYVEMAETWFLRHAERGWSERWCTNQSWLVLFNGAFLCTDYDDRPRYAVDKQDKGDFRIVDTDYLPVHWSDTKYLQIARTGKKENAELIVKALNAYQPKPQRRR
jgi:hypothetical protein